MNRKDAENLARCAREVREIADLLLAKIGYIEQQLSGPAEIRGARPRQGGVTRIAAELGVTKGHVSRCLRGERHSGRVMRAALGKGGGK